MRVILDNDFSGDPDGLFQAAHHLASSAAEIPLIIGSHIHVGDPFDDSPMQAEHAVSRVQQLQVTMNSSQSPQIIAGRNTVPSSDAGAASNAAKRIVQEAMREDTKLPLYYAAGAGLTDLAEALRMEPRIAKRMKLVWIGGMEYPGLHPDIPVRTDKEYNLTIDVEAAQYVFGTAELEIWQVPRDTYRTMLISYADVKEQLSRAGSLGKFLMSQLDRIFVLAPYIGETYILGDSPLVTLTTLQSSFEPDSSSSSYAYQPRPSILKDGTYGPPVGNAKIRVYTSIDTRLTFNDMFVKLSEAGKP